MNAHTARVFSVLVDLDPLAPAGAHRAAAAEEHAEASTAECIGRIISQPRHQPTVARRGSPTRPGPVVRAHPRLRVGALGLLMSAAIAAATMLLWASPSGGEPTQRSSTVPAQVSSAHSQVPPGPTLVAKVTAGRA